MADSAKNRKASVSAWNYLTSWFGKGAQSQWGSLSYYRGFIIRIRNY